MIASPNQRAGYPARRAAQQAKTLARGRLPAVAVDGKTSATPAAPTAPGSPAGRRDTAAPTGPLEVGVKHNETSHFTEP
jgi:hypothetical protein